ncbi:MAG: HNH endonuclease [Lyngbya sp. HA4199-MV5]|jgi:hypothetical protein|nr:HNH endonuclease [Lyngbya sp. HA4199-MV5]
MVNTKFGYAKRARILAKTQNLCWYCGCGFDELTDDLSKAPCLDHVIPQSRGGTHDEENLVASCRLCNARKSSKSLEEFRSSLYWKNSAEYRAICRLEQAMEEASTPFDAEIVKAIAYLKSQIEPIVFYGETLTTIAGSTQP